MNTITITADYDFTPVGKRTVRYVKDHKKIRGYVSGRKYLDFKTWEEAAAWRNNTKNLLPQPWGFWY